MTPSATLAAKVPDAPTTRDLSLDVAKGVGIILVVIGHAWRGVNTAGMVENPTLFQTIDKLIYNFHMPLFFILSGMTFQAWVLRRPAGMAAISRVTRLIWPLILWTYIFTAARIFAGDSANTQLSGWQDLAFWPLPPRDHFWFLWALFLLHIAGIGLIRMVGRPLPPTVWLGLALALILSTTFAPVLLNAFTFGALTNAGAFLIGLWLGPHALRFGKAGVALAATGFIVLQLAKFQLPASLLLDQVFGILLALAALAMIRAAASGTGGASTFLAYLGITSMGIYLSHTIFSAATRAALAPFTTDLSIQMLAGTLAGIAGPLLIYAVIRRAGRPSWIGF